MTIPNLSPADHFPFPCHFLTAPSLAPGRHVPASMQPAGPTQLMGTDNFPEAGSTGRQDWQVGRRHQCDGWPCKAVSNSFPISQAFLGSRAAWPLRHPLLHVRTPPSLSVVSSCPSRCPGHGGGQDA